MDIKFIENMKVNDTFVIVSKTQHTFAIPQLFEVVSIETVKNDIPYDEFYKIRLYGRCGLHLDFQAHTFDTDHCGYILYRNYNEWFNVESKKVEDKKQTYILANKYVLDFENFYSKFIETNPEKFI